ncbi:Glycoside hydrolase, catalytic domain-containing protein [Cynara cardunculus var. scolymus]|uniref:Glycoside hydrolase, catalytic domain-containing protein n=1 Tax=Cynara cardunculus var. scolymus TaxID=59895 RepID=A0A124SBC4_CYNCS|nr:Glycoside hydrolase, catalytic domain-containing protein [Cynara cardunculus var. scolymus]
MGCLLSVINILCLLILPFSFVAADGSSAVGVNYGMIADDLPPPPQVVSLLKSRNIKRVPVGNEVLPGDLSIFVFPAIKNLNAALESVNLGQIPVSTAASISVLGSSYPPSAGDFRGDMKPIMQDLTGFLAGKGFPLLVTAYPYFSYVSDPNSISLSYVLFNSSDVVVKDGDLGYTNMFDAMVDAVYSALEKIGAGSVEVVICETGWPSNGNGDFTTIDLAQTYNQNLVKHVSSSGTPKKPNKNVETYVFALFNEDLKPAGVEQNFGVQKFHFVVAYLPFCLRIGTSSKTELYRTKDLDMTCYLYGFWHD